MSEKAIRIKGHEEIDLSKICYWKIEGHGWMIYFPDGADGFLGGLAKHTVIENKDGTITVSPSILITTTGSKQLRHGYLESGIWRDV